MKRTIRYGTFESNSSSMHSLIIMKDKGVYDPSEFNHKVRIYSDGEWRMYESELGFGRAPFQLLCTFEDKVRFAIASYCGGYTKTDEALKNLKMIEEIVRKYVPGFDSFVFDMECVSVYVDETGNEILSEDMDYSGNGYYEYKKNGVHYTDIYFVTERTKSSPDIIYDITNRLCKRGFFYTNNGKHGFAKLDEDRTIEKPLFGYIDHQSSGLLQNFLETSHVSLEDFLTRKEYVVVIDGDEYYDFERYIEYEMIDPSKIEERIM